MEEELAQSLRNLGDSKLAMDAATRPDLRQGGLLRFVEWEMCPFFTKANIAVVCGLELAPVRAWLSECAEWMVGLYGHSVDSNPKTTDSNEFAVWTVRKLILRKEMFDWQLASRARLVDSTVSMFPREGMRAAVISLGLRFPYPPAELSAAYDESVWKAQRWRAEARSLAAVELREPVGVHLFEREYRACDAGPIFRIPGWVVVDSPTRLQLIDERLVVREHAA
jgi:hypothetical protein